MPVADFPGRFGWGYDGVDLFAPTRLYGTPDDLRRFVDRAHALGIARHPRRRLQPPRAGRQLPAARSRRPTSPTRYENEWGDAINFDGADAGRVREFFVANAGYWIDEFHLDGLRLDATQPILRQLARAHPRRDRPARARGGRRPRRSSRRRERAAGHRAGAPAAAGGYGLDALWNDDFHHSAMVALTGRSEAYYTDYRGAPQEFISAAKYGYLYQGQHYTWQQKRARHAGARTRRRARSSTFLQNHDQVANSGRGLRVPRSYRARPLRAR